MKYNKAAVKAVYDFAKKCTKTQKLSFEICPGLKAKIDYDVIFDSGEYSYELRCEDFVLSKDIKKFFDAVEWGMDALDDNIDYDKYINPILEDLEMQFGILFNEANIDDEYYYMFEYDNLDMCWTDWWLTFLDENVEKPAPPPTIRLNSEYSAIIDRTNNRVTVGCQTIPIEAVRSLLEAYDATT